MGASRASGGSRTPYFESWFHIKPTLQLNSSSCVPASQPSISSPDPTHLPACHTAQSSALRLLPSHLLASIPAAFFPFSLIDAFHIATEGERCKKKATAALVTPLSSPFFFTFPAPSLCLSFTVCLLCSTYASQQSGFPFLRL